MKIVIAGDYAENGRVVPLLHSRKYESVFGPVKDILTGADYSIVNLESPVCESNRDRYAIKKDGPHLYGSRYSVDALKWAGVKCVTLSNNHFYDYGEEGVKETIAACLDADIEYVGAGENIEKASQTLYKKIGKETIAIINCCEHEFSIATNNRGGCNPLNPIQQFYAIKEASKQANYVLVIVHGGPEHHQLPTPRMQLIYRFFVDAGADAVVNHHQHCYSGYEIYNGKPIFYGLGNFCFDAVPVRVNQNWNYGFIVSIIFQSNTVDFKVLPFIQCGKTAGISLIEDYRFYEHLKDLNKIIVNPKLLEKETIKYYKSTSKHHAYQILTPIFSRYWLALVKRGLVPSFISESRKLRVENFVRCESHRDKLMYFFDESII